MSDRKTKDHAEDVEGQHESPVNPAHARVWELARRQGVKPIKSIEQLKGDFWPEEESIDEFLEWLRESRKEGGTRSIPE
ncbi:MAG TPA: hypothetical protein VFA21_17275 [Pyrinomonadaceae bacterium]|jgi:erythromycin esterase-like protein|nr:hypothetical protein [Pyrinomonadaceae bacterium]